MCAVASRFQAVAPHWVARLCQAVAPVWSTSSVGVPTRSVTIATEAGVDGILVAAGGLRRAALGLGDRTVAVVLPGQGGAGGGVGLFRQAAAVPAEEGLGNDGPVGGVLALGCAAAQRVVAVGPSGAVGCGSPVVAGRPGGTRTGLPSPPAGGPVTRWT